jgi:hypothetical protein
MFLGAWPTRADEVPLPPKLTIVQPDSSIPPDVAAFSGKWVGGWDGRLSSVLVVQKINPADGKGRYKAEVLYAWGTYSPWYIDKSGMREMDAEIKDGQLVAEDGRLRIRYRLSGDRSGLEGEYQRAGGYIYPGTFKKAAD